MFKKLITKLIVTILLVLPLLMPFETAKAAIPAAPSNLAATAVSSSQINLTWQDNSMDETGFEIFRNTYEINSWVPISPSCSVANYYYHFVSIATLGADVTTYTDAVGLRANTEYFYYVIAYNASGNSANSNIAKAVTNYLEGVPEAPRDLMGQAVSSRKAYLTWLRQSETNFCGDRLERSESPTGGFQVAGYYDIKNTPPTPVYFDLNVLPNKTYYYRVKHTNSIGSSNYSNLISITTPPDEGVYLGDVPNAVLVEGNYGYVISSTWLSLGLTNDLYTLTVVDISNPRQPRGISSLDIGTYTTYSPLNIAKSGDLIVVEGHPGAAGAQSGIKIIDVSNVNNPQIVGSFLDIPSNNVVAGDGYAYVIAQNGILRVIDIASNPQNPVQVGQLQLAAIDAVWPGITYNDRKIYVGGGLNIYIINVSIPASPSIISTMPVPAYGASYITYDSNRIYVKSTSTLNLDSVKIIDVSVPEAPQELGTIGPMNLNSISAQGNMLYLAYTGGLHAQNRYLSSYNISDPRNPVRQIFVRIDFYKTDIQGQYLYGSGIPIDRGISEGLMVFDVNTQLLLGTTTGGANAILAKAADRTQVSRGEEIKYTIGFLNSYNTFSQISIEDLIPTGTQYVEGSADSGGQFNGTKVIWSWPSHGQYVSRFVTFRVRVL